MKNLLITLVVFGSISLSSSVLAQDTNTGKAAFEQIKECACSEILMISGALEKKYTAIWLEGITYENGFIVFTKGDNRHMWDASKIVFLEKGNGFIRAYVNQSK